MSFPAEQKDLARTLLARARATFGPRRDLAAVFDQDTREVVVWYRTVADVVHDADIEVSLLAAKELDPYCDPGDVLGLFLFAGDLD